MTSRELVVVHIQEEMVRAFNKGDLVDAHNLHAFLTMLEDTTCDEYDELVTEEITGAIS